MEFGKVEPQTLNEINFKLPPDTAITQSVLKAADKKPLKAYVGCAKWGRKEWVGKIYPKGTKDANFLDEYAKHFNSIEMNATFYKIYDAKTIAKWKEKAAASNKDFKFCPKISQPISHIKRLKDAEELTTEFYKGIMAFEEYLGPVFLQLSDNFGPKNLDLLKNYLEHLPQDVPFFVEVRHKDWFEPANSELLFNLLNKLNIGAVITDASGRRDCVHMSLPTPHAFIRFVGNNLHPTDYQRVDDWVERLALWKEQGLQSFYFFMHQHEEKDSPELCKYVIEKLNTRLKLNIKAPHFINEHTLF
ncbi:DUF72 domain-containing protein [Pedobacter cryophilus]|uniref:DUF72 domain-containing protein n=1 Tax=Pedobacter cryophilus TaxID=2571271 RepID=A0A4U1BTW0_9SPHI|nr:DUF72 domain-containing protein [Pedobacter cryophilus]TKB95235.1 DUF72 domain-containing protein [Pedobacter cryophilus]